MSNYHTMHQPANAFAYLLRMHRQAREWSQTKLAERAGLNHATVSRLESGDRNPSREMIGTLARVLDLELYQWDELLESAGFMPDRVASLLSAEPEVVDVLAVLGDKQIPADYRDSVRAVLRGIIGMTMASHGIALHHCNAVNAAKGTIGTPDTCEDDDADVRAMLERAA